MSSGFDEIKRAYMAGRADGIHAASDMLGQFLTRNTDPTFNGMTSEAFVRLCELRMDMAVRAGTMRPRGTTRINDPDGPELVDEVASWPLPKTAEEIAARTRKAQWSPVRNAEDIAQPIVARATDVPEVSGPVVRARDANYARDVASMFQGAQESIAKGVEGVNAVVDVLEALVGSGDKKGKGSSHE